MSHSLEFDGFLDDEIAIPRELAISRRSGRTTTRDGSGLKFENEKKINPLNNLSPFPTWSDGYARQMFEY